MNQPLMRIYSPRVRQLVLDIISSLPKDVQAHAINHCFFIGVGKAVDSDKFCKGFELAIKDLPDDVHLIVLDEYSLSRMDDKEAAFVIRHEMGHAWSTWEGKSPELHERIADQFARKWAV